MSRHIHQQLCRSGDPGEKNHKPTLIDVLNILEVRLDIIEQQCREVSQSIHTHTRTEVNDRIAVMDAEINRCQKMMEFLKNALNETSQKR